MSTDAPPWRHDQDSLHLRVRVVPGASRSALAGEHEGVPRVRVAAPPRDGEANDELCRFLAREVWHLPRTAVQVHRGSKGRDKVVEVRPVRADEVEALLAALGWSGGRASR